MLFLPSTVPIQALRDDLFNRKEVYLSVLRLDTVHPVISGNKLFKLHYLLQNALQQSSEGIVTFGGAYSNHLVAVAYACREAGLKSVALIRGEPPPSLSHTLLACREYGMALQFISREDYTKKDQPDFLQQIAIQHPGYLMVPEGGYHPLGAVGAALIMGLVPDDISHICCAVGTATTVAGLLQAAKKDQEIIGVPVLKDMHDLQLRVAYLTKQPVNPYQLRILSDYHFGGYAKKTPGLINFMNDLFMKQALSTDFVYTAKMMFAIMDGIKKGFFPKGSKIMCIHTGGLQGNISLQRGLLHF